MRKNADAKTLTTILPQKIEDLASRVLKKASSRELKLVTVESCTGGLLSSLLTDIEGASHAFERGFAAYSENAKCELLNIRREQIEECGAVSEAVARAMAEGGLAKSHGDIAISITGFAGPGAPDDEPGLVYFACVRKGAPAITREEHFGDIGRGPVRLASLRVALEMMETMVDQEPYPDS